MFLMNDVHHHDVVHIIDRLLAHASLRDAFAAPSPDLITYPTP